MTTAEQDIEMYMRVYAAAVTGLVGVKGGIGSSELRELADIVADDAVKMLRQKVTLESKEGE